MKGNQRTVAFQEPDELFARFKEYLKKNSIKQNTFFLDCIQEALEAEQREVDKHTGMEYGRMQG